MPLTVERANSPNDLLHRVVRETLPELRSTVEEAGRSLPRYVERELEHYIACDPVEGFAWLWCEHCDHHQIIPLSCKGRGFCPSCGGRRMAEHAAHWTDRVIPFVPVRQWVLTVPWPRRYLLAQCPELAKGALHVALDAIFGWYRDRGRSSGIPDGQTGAVTVIQRAGSTANLNLHFHSLVVDGVYHRDEKSGHLWFKHVSGPTSEEVASLVATIADRVEHWPSGPRSR